MKIITGENLFSELGKADLLLFTANSTLNREKALVMGAGAALTARQRMPDLSHALGVRILGRGGSGGKYGIVSVQTQNNKRVGAFQTKYHFRDKADIELIAFSCMMLKRFAPNFERIAMNYPGIGLGGLSEHLVQPIIETLPDNVFIYKNIRR
jgi:hypothetical protein